MSYLSNEERVRELARQIAPFRGDKPAPFISAGGLKVAAVRTTVRRYRSLRDYVEDQNEPVARAAAAGCQLVAFPELGRCPPFRCCPDFRRFTPTSPGYGSRAASPTGPRRLPSCVRRYRVLWERFSSTPSRSSPAATGSSSRRAACIRLKMEGSPTGSLSFRIPERWPRCRISFIPSGGSAQWG